MPGIVPGELGRVDALYANFKRAEVRYWPIAAHFTLGPDVCFQGKAEVANAKPRTWRGSS